MRSLFCSVLFWSSGPFSLRVSRPLLQSSTLSKQKRLQRKKTLCIVFTETYMEVKLWLTTSARKSNAWQLCWTLCHCEGHLKSLMFEIRYDMIWYNNSPTRVWMNQIVKSSHSSFQDLSFFHTQTHIVPNIHHFAAINYMEHRAAAATVAQWVQNNFITAMDCLKLNMVAVDQLLHPLLSDLYASLNKLTIFEKKPDFEGKTKMDCKVGQDGWSTWVDRNNRLHSFTLILTESSDLTVPSFMAALPNAGAWLNGGMLVNTFVFWLVSFFLSFFFFLGGLLLLFLLLNLERIWLFGELVLWFFYTDH